MRGRVVKLPVRVASLTWHGPSSKKVRFMRCVLKVAFDQWYVQTCVHAVKYHLVHSKSIC